MSVLELSEHGLYCPAGDFYVDPWKPVHNAVVTHGHSDHARPGSRRYHATSASLPILERRVGDPQAELVGREYGEVFRLGDALVSLHPAGHILGSAQVRIEVDGEVWVVSGDYKRDHDPTCRGFEVVECDTFITEATFALPVYAWEPGEVVGRDIWRWWQENARRGLTSIVFCYTLGKAQRVVAELAKWTQDPVWVHGAVDNLMPVYRDAGIQLLETRRIADAHDEPSFAGSLVLAPPSAQTPGWMRRFGPYRTAFVSGWMRVRGIRRRRGFDHGFVMSDHADWNGLVRTIEETGARRVLATHGRTEALVRYLRERGLQADALQTAFGEEDE